jgi:hypothetical protein
MSISASKTPGGRAATTLIVVNMLFVLAWPTLTAAMTGYVPTVDAYVRDFDDTLVKYTEFSLLAYILHDGWRVNLDGDYAVLLVDRPPLPGEYTNSVFILNTFSSALTWSLD